MVCFVGTEVRAVATEQGSIAGSLQGASVGGEVLGIINKVIMVREVCGALV